MASPTAGNPFQYRYQLRLKVTSNSLVYTFWISTSAFMRA